MNSKHEFHDSDIDKVIPNSSESLTEGNSNHSKWFFGSNTDLKQNSNIYYIKHNSTLRSKDLSNCTANNENEIQIISTSLKGESALENLCYEHSNSSEDHTVHDKEKETVIKDINLTYEQFNVEECLLDLDDYLKNIEEKSFQNIRSGSTIVNSLADTIGCYQFKHGMQHRNTISCPTKNQSSNMQYYRTSKTPSVYATCRRQEKRNADDKQTNREKRLRMNKSNLSINGDSMQNFTLANELKALESPETNTVLKLNNNCLNNPKSIQVLSNDQIFHNLVEQSEIFQNEISYERPRQIGRRAERCLMLSNIDNNARENTDNISYHDFRPMSAPAISGTTLSQLCSQNPMFCLRQNDNSAQLRFNENPTSLQSISNSVGSFPVSNNMIEDHTINSENVQQSSSSVDPENCEPFQNSSFKHFWPYKLNRMLELISCTLGLFNISRFACLTINYGENFLIQFLILSIIFGIPFMWLQMCLGAKIKAGPISMWKISPICNGIGISLVLIQYFITIYSSVVVAWLLIYIGDLFIHQSSYPWGGTLTLSTTKNSSIDLTKSVSDYFNINVLQRLHILQINDDSSPRLHVNDRLAFYLAILWAIMFVIFCRGFKSFGKILFTFGFLPIGLLVAITGKLLNVVGLDKIQNIFSSSEFDDFFLNSKTWSAAAQETFFTWGLLGASTIVISSRTHKDASKFTFRREAILVAVVTMAGLFLSALTGLCIIEILNHFGYIYVPGSYENSEVYSAIYSIKSLPSSEFISFPSKYVHHYSGLIGEVYRRHNDINNVSGYQVLRFVSELLPAAAVISTETISWIWIAVIFIALFTFGLSQMYIMWKPISNSLGNSNTSVFLCCVTGLLLSIPFTTEIGIKLLHYMDIVIGGAWFLPAIWAAEIFGVFLIRGRPYNGDDLVNDLKLPGFISTFVALSWNILLPIGLLTLAVINYKTSLSSQLYYWRGNSYFSYWLRKVGAFIQITFLLLIPLAAFVQIYRYLTTGPPDILDRIQMLYRPLDEADCETRNEVNTHCREVNQTDNVVRQLGDEDDPPKYTPPPSYTTATGARLAKLFRQSIRYSIRRVLRGSGRSSVPAQGNHCSNLTIYSSVRNGNHEAINDSNPTEGEEIESETTYNSPNGSCLSLPSKLQLQNHRILEPVLKQRETSLVYSSDTFPIRKKRILSNDRPYTAEDVITILKSSNVGRRRFLRSTRSIENLVFNAEPPDVSSGTIFENLNRKN